MLSLDEIRTKYHEVMNNLRAAKEVHEHWKAQFNEVASELRAAKIAQELADSPLAAAQRQLKEERLRVNRRAVELREIKLKEKFAALEEKELRQRANLWTAKVSAWDESAMDLYADELLTALKYREPWASYAEQTLRDRIVRMDGPSLCVEKALRTLGWEG